MKQPAYELPFRWWCMSVKASQIKGNSTVFSTAYLDRRPANFPRNGSVSKKNAECVSISRRHHMQANSGPRLNIKTVLPGIWIPVLVRQSSREGIPRGISLQSLKTESGHDANFVVVAVPAVVITTVGVTSDDKSTPVTTFAWNQKQQWWKRCRHWGVPTVVVMNTTGVVSEYKPLY